VRATGNRAGARDEGRRRGGRGGADVDPGPDRFDARLRLDRFLATSLGASSVGASSAGASSVGASSTGAAVPSLQAGAEAAGDWTRSRVRALIMAGAAQVNGRVARQPTMRLNPGDRVLVALATGGPRRPPPGPPPSLDERAVLFEDDCLLVVNKPAGLPMHRTVDRRRDDLYSATQRLLAARAAADPAGAVTAADSTAGAYADSPAGERVAGASSPAPYLGLHHRLDRDTSGAVLFTRDPGVNAAIARQFAERQVAKAYLAVCGADDRRWRPPDRWEVRNHLGPAGRRGKRTTYGPVRSGGNFAYTELETVRRVDAVTWLIAARPHTGRTHQVRVHLAGSGLPIVGDDLYGGRPATRALLHAFRLGFRHPRTGAAIEVEAPLPADFPPFGG
jgi:RluA family pseudouridine synthase